MKDDSFLGLKMLVDKLVGKPCWGISAGGCTGSRFILKCGKQLKRDRPLTNTHLPELQRLYEAELGVNVGCAAWRLDGENEVITSSTDDSSPSGPMVHGLSRLIGTYVTCAQVTRPGMDLVLEFQDGLRLRVFCDQFESGCSNYSVFCGELSLTVGSRSELATEGPAA